MANHIYKTCRNTLATAVCTATFLLQPQLVFAQEQTEPIAEHTVRQPFTFDQLLQLLVFLATTPQGGSSGISDQNATTLLVAQRYLASELFGLWPTGPYLTEMLARQNDDGGIGYLRGSVSYPAETALAVIALVCSNRIYDTATIDALTYLRSYIESDAFKQAITQGGDAAYIAGIIEFVYQYVVVTWNIQLPNKPGTSAADRLFSGQNVLFGAYYRGSGGLFRTELQDLERSTGKVPLVKRYHDFSNSSAPTQAYPEQSGWFPDTTEQAWLNEGRTVDFTWETRVYSKKYLPKDMPQPQGIVSGLEENGRYVYTYQQITSGQLDNYLSTVAERLSKIDRPFFITFNHEWDDSSALSSDGRSYGSNKYRQAAGTPREYAQAFRYIVTFMRNKKVDNAVWVWGVSGWQSSDKIYQDGWPGSDYVDVIGWDPYNHNAGSWQTPKQTFGKFYDRLDGTGGKAPMLDAVDTKAKNLPRMLSEYGTINSYNRGPEWLSAVPAALKELPKLRAIIYFSSNSTWDTRLSNAELKAAFGKIRAQIVGQ